ncbi:immunoglobulin superfamily member 1-like [Trachemys scripta elegans]|uniref:immunoglobulin superfamily member 1-like n=1 Tax=Trachemys scripta elegans TaxID=31138 RepID=UPI0015556B6B|nr:immunoglobulin superfamily member 1-like [Trachemys scripta elegans]
MSWFNEPPQGQMTDGLNWGGGRQGAVSPLFNSCLLFKAGREFRKPTIWVSPSRVVALGGNVTIRCEGRYRSMEFFLRKAGHPNPQAQSVPDGTMAEFPIASVSREDGGSYTCDYRSITDQNRTSHPSDPVRIIVVEPSYPKPNISLSPSGGVSLGGAVSVWCRGQHQGVRFVLNKEGHHFPPVDTDEFEVVFPISNVSREDGGSYSCYYHSRSEPFAVSYPSDPVELVVRDPNLPRPSISLSPTGVTAPGADATIRCQGQRRDVRFFLHKAGDLNPPRHMDPAGDGAEFHIPTVGWQHGGSYSCSYRNRSEPFISSEPSDPVQLVVAGGPVPSAAPVLTCSIIAGVSAAAVGLLLLLLLLLAFVCYRRTRGRKGPAPRQSRESEAAATVYALVAEGKQMDVLSQETDPGAEGLTYAELDGQVLQAKRGGPAPAPEPVLYATINVSKGLTGTPPRVQKRPPPTPMATQLDPPVWSHPSDSVELLVAEPKPSISLHPSGRAVTVRWREFLKPTVWVSPSRVVALGGNVTIRCAGRYPGMEFFLRKAGHPNLQVRTVPDGTVAEFPIANVSREDGGSYTCDYRSIAEQNRWSYPSDSVEIIVGEPKPNISLHPSGRAVTIRCECRCHGARVLLSKILLEIAEKPSDGAERCRVHHGLPGAAAPSAVLHSARTWASGWVELGTGVLVAALRGPHCPIMASALTVLLLGCFLAVHSWVLGGREYPKPPIWVSPSRVVALGGNVTIRCAGLYPGMEFFLRKAGHPNRQAQTVPDGTVAEFPIASVSREDGGSYTCDYRSIAEQNRTLHPSDPVRIIVGEPSYPKPSIYLRPSGGVSLGGAVSVWCRGQHRGMRFVLNKERRHFPPVDSDEFEVVFPISNVSWEDGRSYSCSYHSRLEPFTVSYPSDPVELVVRGEGPSSASPFPAPPPARPSRGLGANGTLRARLCPEGLGGAGHRGVGGSAEGPLPDPVMASALTVLFLGCWLAGRSGVSGEGSLPKPSISVSPGGVIPMGGNVTIRCRNQRLGMRFLFYKDGDENYLNYTDPAGSEAEFPITSARREHGGNYTCRYSDRTGPTNYSERSDPVQIIVAGEGPSPASPAPHPARSPGGSHQWATQSQALP